MRRSSTVTNYLVVATADSSPQMQASEEEITRRLNEQTGLTPVHREGRFGATWRVLDYGGCVIHLFTEHARGFYGLERLWEHAKPVDWSKPPDSASRSSARRGGPIGPETPRRRSKALSKK